MYRTFATIILLMVIFVSATRSYAFSFHGKQWSKYYDSQDIIPSQHIEYHSSTTTNSPIISGLQRNKWLPYEPFWFNNDNSMVYSSGDHALQPNGTYIDTLHVKFVRRPNLYYFGPNDTVTQRELFDTLRLDSIRFATHYELFDRVQLGANPHNPLVLRDTVYDDSLANLCGFMMKAMSEDSVWFTSVGAICTSYFRYGKFHWETTTDFTSWTDSLDAGVFSDDPWNLEWARNEIDIEISKFWYNGHDTNWVTNLPYGDSTKLRLSIFPTSGPDPRPGQYDDGHRTYQERKRCLVPPPDIGIHVYEYTYKPDTVRFNISGPMNEQSWIFPQPNTPYCHEDSFFDYRTGSPTQGQTLPAPNAILVAPCGEHNSVLATIEHWGPNPKVSGLLDPNSLDMVFSSFEWTGIPDISFIDTVGAPWPWAQVNPWNPDTSINNITLNKPVMLNGSNSGINNTITYEQLRNQQIPAYIDWVAHNVGTATAYINGDIRTDLFLDDTINTVRTWIRTDSIRIGEVYSSLFTRYQLPTLKGGTHHIKLLADSQNNLEELRESNNTYTDSIEVLAPDLSFWNGGISYVLPNNYFLPHGHEFGADSQLTPLVCNRNTAIYTNDWSNTSLLAGARADFRWTFHNMGTENSIAGGWIVTTIEDIWQGIHTTIYRDSTYNQLGVDYTNTSPIAEGRYFNFAVPININQSRLDTFRIHVQNYWISQNVLDTVQEEYMSNNTFDLPVYIVGTNNQNGGGGLHGECHVSTPCPISCGDTLKISTYANVVFSDSGKIIIPNGAVLQFLGRDGNSNPTDVAYLHGDGQNFSDTTSRIVIEPGGKVIGKHVRFAQLPFAIQCDSGTVKLDSSSFDTCAIGIYSTSCVDTVMISNSTFDHDSLAMSLADTSGYIAITGTTFSYNTKALELPPASMASILVRHCTFENNNVACILSNTPYTPSQIYSYTEVDSSTFSYNSIGVNVDGAYSSIPHIMYCTFDHDSLAVLINNKVQLSNSTFTGNTQSVRVKSGVSNGVVIDNNDFTQTDNYVFWIQGADVTFGSNAITYTASNDNQSSVFLDNCESVRIISCTITGKGSGSGIYAEMCDGSNWIDDSNIRDFTVGAYLIYSNLHFTDDTLSTNGFAGFEWIQDYPYDYYPGRIDHCLVDGNGFSYSNGAGLWTDAAGPIITCSHFYSNYDNAVNAFGNPAPSFYDWEYNMVGANQLEATNSLPIVLLRGCAYPTFIMGNNDFVIADTSDLYMQDNSNPIYCHYLDYNYFNKGFDTLNFNPPFPVFWQCNNQSSSGICNVPLAEYQGGGGMMMLLQGNAQMAAHDTMQAIASFTSAVTLSGDTLESGVAGLSKLAKLTGQLPAVGSRLHKERLYASSYHYDRTGNFTISDGSRDSILTIGDHLDSVRVRLDHAMSLLLRPHSMSTGIRAEREHDRVTSNIRSIANELAEMKKLVKPHDLSTDLPTDYKLYPTYPNPFNATTTIRFAVPQTGPVQIAVYDRLGRKVVSLAHQTFIRGTHELIWDGKNSNGSRVSSGAYFVSMRSPSFTATKKMVLLK